MSSSQIREKRMDALATAGFAIDVSGVILEGLFPDKSVRQLSDEDIRLLETAKDYFPRAKDGWRSVIDYMEKAIIPTNFDNEKIANACLQAANINPDAHIQEFDELIDSVCDIIQARIDGELYQLAYKNPRKVDEVLFFLKRLADKQASKSLSMH